MIPKDGASARRGTAGEVFAAFLKLGLTSFGGPIAHLGYFREELVTRRRWIDDRGYAELVALCQFLPGPASSQAGFALGLMRAGLPGALAAWTAFTLPSALMMLAFAYASASLQGPIASAALHGLKLVAVAIVAQALWGMARTLVPDLRRAAIALVAVAVVMLVDSTVGQVGAILIGMVAGSVVIRDARGWGEGFHVMRVNRRAGLICLAIFGLLLLILPLGAEALDWRPLALFDQFYRAGALVFGGGHIVLPLLREGLVPTGWLTDDAFLAGYGAAQALPGPLFAFSAYLGAVSGAGPWGAAVALAGIFLPGLLLVTGALPFWSVLRRSLVAQAAIAGANAAVVGILAAALYDPLWTTSVASWADAGIVFLGFAALVGWRVSPIIAVIAMVAGTIMLRT